jgi:hypothetical protein
LKTQAALISRQATSLALKCSPSKELLDKLQKAIHNLNLEADTYLSEMHEKSQEIPPVPIESVREPLNGVISFKIPQVIKGPKNTRFKNIVEKKAGKKKKGAQKEGSDLPTNFCLSIIFLKKILHYHIYLIVGEDLENNDVETRVEHAPFMQDGYADPNQMTVRQ